MIFYETRVSSAGWLIKWGLTIWGVDSFELFLGVHEDA